MLLKNQFYLKFYFYLLMVSLSVFFLLSNNQLVQFLGFLILGIINAHGIQLLHQASHRQASPNKTRNDIYGFILGAVAFIPFTSYRKIHLDHHKNLGTKDDAEFFGFEKFSIGTNKSTFLRTVFSFQRFRDLFSTRRANADSFVPLFFFSVLIICLHFNSIFIVICWIGSYLFVTEPIHFLIEIPEHYECDKLSSNKDRNTRTILKVSRFLGWFTNWNNFHSEHHRCPNVLPEKLHLLAKDKKADGRYCHNNYLEFFIFYISSLAVVKK